MNSGRPSKPYIRYNYGHQRTVYISAAAAGALDGRVTLYQNGGVLALVSDPDGDFDVNAKPKANSKLINTQALVYYLASKFPKGDTIPVWVDEGHHALLFGQAGARKGFGPGFHRLHLAPVSQFRCLPVGECLYVVHRAPRRCTPYISGSTLYLKAGCDGQFVRIDGDEGAFYRSNALADFCEKKWKGHRIFQRVFPDGLLLSPNYAMLAEAEGLPEGLTEVSAEVSTAPTLPTIKLCRDRSVQISQAAFALLGTRVRAYMSQGYLALHPDREGDLRFCAAKEGGASIFNMPLAKMILSYYPFAEELLLKPHGQLFVLAEESAVFPPEDFFFRVCLT